MLYPVCDSVRCWLERALQSSESARRSKSGQPPGGGQQRARQGFWTRKLRLAMDGKEGRSESSGPAVSGEEPPPTTRNENGVAVMLRGQEKAAAKSSAGTVAGVSVHVSRTTSPALEWAKT